MGWVGLGWVGWLWGVLGCSRQEPADGVGWGRFGLVDCRFSGFGAFPGRELPGGEAVGLGLFGLGAGGFWWGRGGVLSCRV